MASTRTGQAPDHFAIGIDVGTSAVKGAVLTDAGASFSYSSTGYVTSRPASGWAEQNPDDWWHAVGEVLDQILEAHPLLNASNASIGLTGQMHTTVARDDRGRLLRPAILWSDNRAAELTPRLVDVRPDWVDVTGNEPIPAFTSAHLAWLHAKEPKVFARIGRVSVPKDEIRHRLGAGWATEPSDASAMNLMDTRTDRWAVDLLNVVGIPAEALPPIVASDHVTGNILTVPPLKGDHARLLGTPVIAGAADQAAQALALGAVADGQIAVSVGTSGAAFQAISQPRPGSFRHAIPGTWLALDSTHAAGLALWWWSRVSNHPLDAVSTIDRGDTDLPLFLPYLQGGRDGHGAPGTLTDLRSTHTAADISHAVVEGVGIELVRLVRQASLGRIPEAPIGVGGRAAQIQALRDVMAAGLDRPIRYSGQGPAHGAALLAASSAGWEPDQSVASMATVITNPDPETAARLAPRIDRFARLVDQLS